MILKAQFYQNLELQKALKLFKNAESEYMDWLNSNPNGFVLNCNKVEDEIFVRDYFVMDKARCFTIPAQTGRYKI